MSEAPEAAPEAGSTPSGDRPEAELAAAIRLGEGETLDRVYLFESVERGEVSFTLALVTKRLDGGRLEMVALGGRVDGGGSELREFVRRARFPEDLLPEILAEFIDRCGVEGAAYREVSLADPDAGAKPLERLADLLAPAGQGP